MNEKSLRAIQQVGPYEDEHNFGSNNIKTVWTAVVEQKDDGMYTFHIAYSITCKDKNLLHFVEKGIPRMYQFVPISRLSDDYPLNYISKRLTFKDNERRDKNGNFVYERSETLDNISFDNLQKWYDTYKTFDLDKADIRDNWPEASKLFYKHFSVTIELAMYFFEVRGEER